MATPKKAKRPEAYAQLGPEEDRVRKIVVDWYNGSGMSQQQIADKLKWGQSRVSSILVGRSAISLDTLPLIAEVFGHKAHDVYEKNPNKAADPVTEGVMKRFRPLSSKQQKIVLDVMDGYVHRK